LTFEVLKDLALEERWGDWEPTVPVKPR
jgi:hypothetical protein